MEEDWDSPYLDYIAKIRQEVGLFNAPPSLQFLKVHLENWAVNKVNSELLTHNLPYVQPIMKFVRQNYVLEHEGCTSLAEFRLSNAGLGNRAPRVNRQRTSSCSLCQGNLSELHVAFECTRLHRFRLKHTGITRFLAMCLAGNVGASLAFKRYLLGLDWNGQPIPTSQFLERGLALRAVKERWLEMS